MLGLKVSPREIACPLPVQVNVNVIRVRGRVVSDLMGQPHRVCASASGRRDERMPGRVEGETTDTLGLCELEKLIHPSDHVPLHEGGAVPGLEDPLGARPFLLIEAPEDGGDVRGDGSAGVPTAWADCRVDCMNPWCGNERTSTSRT